MRLSPFTLRILAGIHKSHTDRPQQGRSQDWHGVGRYDFFVSFPLGQLWPVLSLYVTNCYHKLHKLK